MDFDLIIIGSGQAGGPLASAAAAAGQRVALIECKHVGGTCVNEGCTPTKTMVASAKTAYLAGRSADFGVHTGPVSVDMAQVRARKNEVVASFRDSNQKSFEKNENIELIWGEATFKDAKTVAVALSDGGERTLSAETVAINAGQRPNIPPIEGLKDTPFLTSTTIMELGEVPEHLVILGGGYIGLEFAQMFRRFGSKVTIVQRGKQLLPREDQDVADAVADILREDGVTVLLGATTEKVSSENGVTLSLEGGENVSGSHLLVATGRTPNSNFLNLEAAGIHTNDKGYIEVDDKLETNVLGVYALGDIKGGPAFTHISYDDFRILKANLLDDGDRSIAGRIVPYTVFMDPQLGRVGLSERDAAEQGKMFKVAKLPMSSVARAIEKSQTRGFMKALVDSETEQILGAAILGLGGGEVMSVLQVAMMGELPYTALRDSPFAHPTLSESLNNLFMTL